MAKLSFRFSIKDSKTEKLADTLLSAEKEALLKNDNLSEEEIKNIPADLFTPHALDEAAAEKTGYSSYSYWGSTVRTFAQNKMAVTMLGIIAVILLFTFIQPYLPGQYDPNYINNDPVTGMQIMNEPPGKEFWFGTNAIGQDMWARIWAGTKNSLFIGFSVAIIQAFVGIVMGMIWGYVRATDFFFTELYNVISNIPTTIVLILASYVMKPSVRTLIIAMCVTGWLGMARFIRNQVLIIRDQEFNMASRCLGTPVWRVITKNLLPHMVSVIMLQMALAIPGAIASEVFLTYIGRGVPLDTPSLGNLVDSGRALMMSPSLRYQLLFPAIMLSIITVCFYLVGNAFADAADPKNHM